MPELYKREVDNYLPHFSQQVSQAIVDYATDEVFKSSRYIFTRRQGKQQYGYCTHCKQEFKTAGLKHNEIDVECPSCKSMCIVKASGYGRKRMVDEAYFVYYEKSVLNPQAIVARGIYAVRDYRFDYHKVETQFKTAALYVFEPGNSRMFKRYLYYSGHAGECIVGYWDKCKSVFSLFNNQMMNIRNFCSRGSIKEAVKGTSFNWSGWELYDYDDMVKFFDLYSRYPCIEYLTKLGLKGLVKAKLDGGNTYSAINWRGNSLQKVLRMTPSELAEIKASGVKIDFSFLKLLQIQKKDGSKLSFAEISEIDSYFYSLKDLQGILNYTTLGRAFRYMKKQYEKHHKEHFYSETTVLFTWRDYISDCIKLKMDLTKTNVLFPRNLYTAHQNTIRQIKIKADKELNKKIQRRAKTLYEKYYFEYKGLMIKPAESTNELIREGKMLDHCVGNYAKRYSEGETNILFIRKHSNPNKPYYTVELRGGVVVQVRGVKNCNPNKKITEFVEVFKAEKLQKKKAEARITIPA